MTPETAVTLLAQLIASREAFTEDEAYDAMERAGIPPGLADRAFKLLQVAWGRAFLAPMGVRFAAEYLWFDGKGNVAEEGLLADDPFFVAGEALARQYGRHPGFRQMAQMSADVSAVNQALENGSKADDLETGPAGFLLENVSAAGMKKVHEELGRRMKKEKS